jgi:methionyl-tRNA synthetase
MQARVGAILHVLTDALAHASRLLAPFMPETATRIATLLGIEVSELSAPMPTWFDSFPGDHRVARPEPLFPRVEVEKSD